MGMEHFSPPKKLIKSPLKLDFQKFLLLFASMIALQK